jgi:hypothetical protein
MPNENLLKEEEMSKSSTLKMLAIFAIASMILTACGGGAAEPAATARDTVPIARQTRRALISISCQRLIGYAFEPLLMYTSYTRPDGPGFRKKTVRLWNPSSFFVVSKKMETLVQKMRKHFANGACQPTAF